MTTNVHTHSKHAAACILVYANIRAVDDAAVHRLRGRLAERLALWVGEDVVDVAALLAGELLANVSHHARGPDGARPSATLSAVVDRGRLVVEVGDTDPNPPVRHAGGMDDECGRGLALLEALAVDWGVCARAGGKTVWFRLATGS